MKTAFTAQELHNFIEIIKDEYAVVRLVNPTQRKVLDLNSGKETREICNSIWGRNERCENCTSVRALQSHKNAHKVEFVHEKVYFITSKYVEIDGEACILEMVTDATDDFLANSDQKDAVAQFIVNHNDLLITDPLTGLFNRRFLDEHFIPSLTCCYDLAVPVNLSILDIDRFKAINDKHGHLAGDQVLKDVAGFWKLHFNSREKNKERLVIRYGGDEMLILACGMPQEEFTQKLTDCYEAMRKICFYDEKLNFSFGISFGSASSTELKPDWRWADLFALADERLYIAKKKHKITSKML